MTELTDARRRALRILADAGSLGPYTFAQRMWPHSPGWRKRSHRHDGNAGAVGASMPMKGGAFLARLRDDGLAAGGGEHWHITPAGRSALGEDTLPLVDVGGPP